MSSIRVSGNTSGYYDLTVPDVAGQNTIPLNQVVTTDTNGHIQISGGSTNNDDSAAVITAASTEHAKIRIDTSSTSNHRATLALESGSYEVNIATSGLDEMRFSTQNTSDALFIGSNGRIGIGTTGPVEGLEVFGTNGADNMALKYSGTAGGHQSGYLWKDFRGQPNAGIYNNLQDDGVGSAAAQMEFYTSHAGTMTKQMEINRYGAVTTPSQPAFRAYLSTEWSTIDAYVNSGWTNQYNRGNCFNQGTFTAPVDGVYNFTVAWDALNTQSQLHLDRNGSYAGGFRYEPTGRTDDGWESHSYSVQTQLNANDYVKLYLDGGGGSNPIHMGGNQWGFFAGYLVG